MKTTELRATIIGGSIQLSARTLLLVAVPLHVISVQSDVLNASDSMTLPQEVNEALTDSVSALNPISVAWRRTRTSPLPLEEALSRINGSDYYGFFKPFDALYQRQSASCYFSETTYIRTVAGEITSGLREVSFDGEKVYVGNGAKGDAAHTPILRLQFDERAPAEFGEAELCYPEYFLAAGFQFPYAAKDLLTPPQHLVLSLIQQGDKITAVREASREGAYQVELAGNNGRNLFGLAPEYGYAMRWREARNASGRLVQRIENSEFERVGTTNTWLPRVSTVAHYSWTSIPGKVYDQVVVEEVFSVSQIKRDRIPADRFALTDYTEPGTHIADGTISDETVYYQIPVNPADLDRVVEAALQGRTYEPIPQEGSRWFMLWFNIGLVVLLSVAVWVRFRSKSVRKENG